MSTTDDPFDVYRPMPPLCRAVMVTDDNIDQIARFLRSNLYAKTVVTHRWGQYPTLQILFDYHPEDNDHETITVTVGEMLVLKTEPPDPPVITENGWHVVGDKHFQRFKKQWRKISG